MNNRHYRFSNIRGNQFGKFATLEEAKIAKASEEKYRECDDIEEWERCETSGGKKWDKFVGIVRNA